MLCYTDQWSDFLFVLSVSGNLYLLKDFFKFIFWACLPCKERMFTLLSVALLFMPFLEGKAGGRQFPSTNLWRKISSWNAGNLQLHWQMGSFYCSMNKIIMRIDAWQKRLAICYSFESHQVWDWKLSLGVKYASWDSWEALIFNFEQITCSK